MENLRTYLATQAFTKKEYVHIYTPTYLSSVFSVKLWNMYVCACTPTDLGSVMLGRLQP